MKADVGNRDSRRTVRNIHLLGVKRENILQLPPIDEAHVHALMTHSPLWKGEKLPHEPIAESRTHWSLS